MLSQLTIADDGIFHVFSFMRIFACAIFFLDLIFGSIIKPDYNLTLTWWLDFISAVSMIPFENIDFDMGTNDVDTNYLVTLKTFKLARATRLLKMVRVFVHSSRLPLRLTFVLRLSSSLST